MRKLLCVLLFAGVLPCYADVILSISPATQTVALGSPANFNLNVSGLGNGTALGTYDLNVAFDPALLSYSSTSFGSQLDVLGFGDIQSATSGNGTIEVFELSLDAPGDLLALQASSFTLATLNFSAMANGTSPLTVSLNAVGNQSGNSVSATLMNGSVTIGSSSPVNPSPVPEPSSFYLLSTGFAAVGAVYRQLQQRAGRHKAHRV